MPRFGQAAIVASRITTVCTTSHKRSKQRTLYLVNEVRMFLKVVPLQFANNGRVEVGATLQTQIALGQRCSTFVDDFGRLLLHRMQ